MALASLPQELVDNIVDHLDNQDLFTCSLVSSIFLSRCRKHLFRTLSIMSIKSRHLRFIFNENQRGRSGVVEFLTLLRVRPIFQSYIRHLRVDLVLGVSFIPEYNVYSHGVLHEVLQLLCPTVQDFTLKLADQTRDKWQQAAQRTNELFQLPFVLHNATTLDLESIHSLPFDLARCSNLGALKVRKCTFELGIDPAASIGQQNSVLGKLTSFSGSIRGMNVESSLRFVEGVLQLSAKNIERLELVYDAGSADLGYPNTTIRKVTEGFKSSEILSLANFPSLRHLNFEVVDDLFYREENGFSPIAELLKTCTPNSKLSSISVLTTLHIAHSRLSKSTDDLYEDWEWRNWGVLDQPLFNLGKTLQRPIALQLHAHVEANYDRMLLFPKPDLGREPNFKSLFRDKFPQACRSQFLSWKYDWTIYEC